MMWAFFVGAIVFGMGVLVGYGIAVAMMRTILDSDYLDD
jgi:hypothetical protein